MKNIELTNQQRIYLGLEPIEENWIKKQIRDNLWIYINGTTICKRISISDVSYTEEQLDAPVDASFTTLQPKTTKGKAKKLTPSSVSGIQPTGVYFYYNSGKMLIASYTTQTTFYNNEKDSFEYHPIEELPALLEQWIADSTEEDLAALETFRTAKRKHCIFKEGDFFRFKIGRRMYGYGRILMNIDKFRKTQKYKEKDYTWFRSLMGKPLLIKVYHKLSSSAEVPVEELAACTAFPSQTIMDNIFYYGECEIIGHKELELTELDMPISYGRSIDSREPELVYLQYGLIYQKTSTFQFKKYLKDEHAADSGRCETNPYSGNSIGFHIDIARYPELMQRCIEVQSNLPYWNSDIYRVNYDLRNPKNEAIKREIFNHFNLDTNCNYAELYQSIYLK